VPAERALAFRNHGLLQEALRYDTTPVGLHYLLVHYDVPALDHDTWTLEVDGLVERPLSISIDAIRRRPTVTQRVTFECAGNGRSMMLPRALSVPWGVDAVGTAEWTGTPLWPLLDEAGVAPDAVEVIFRGADAGVEKGVAQNYERSLRLEEARRDDVILAHTMNGQPLPPQHGSPLRLVVPGWYGMTNVKWLTHITAVDRPFNGFQHRAYTIRMDEHDPGVPVDRIKPRALLVPPGVPDFTTRARYLTPGPVPLEGRAWSGFAPIDRVELTVDGGESWFDATLDDQPEPYAWVRWTGTWHAAPGAYQIGCRATDRHGETQPLEPAWNIGGFACQAVHYLDVTVSSE